MNLTSTMKYFLQAALFAAVLAASTVSAQQPARKQSDKLNETETRRILQVLASDSMEGRAVFTPGIEKAAAFIAAEFKAAGLQPLHPDSSFLQHFTVNALARRFAGKPLFNVVGILPGKSKKDEYVIFSGHYDHLGTGKPVNGDSIYNGANDDASGITAVIMLAKYFKALDKNERTLIFAAFTAEETGGMGSRYFSRELDSSRVMAMFNIEMIGTGSKWGANSAYITGYEKSDMGKILQKNLENTPFRFYPDPYPEQQLFYRSDNATLARQGVPAHTISTSKMDSEPYYHTVEDEIETLDIKNMTEIIRAIGHSAQSIITGKDTPSRVDAGRLR